MNTKQALLKSFEEKFVADNGTSWKMPIGAMSPEEFRRFLSSALDTIERETVGVIGAKLLEQHSPQAVLDAYFNIANEILDETTD